MRTNEIRHVESYYDLMSYCHPTWTSDYTYEAVLAFRETTGGVSVQGGAAGSAVGAARQSKAAATDSNGGASGAAQPSLLVWGRITADGAVLEPSFEVVTAPVLPGGAGRYRLTGSDRRGATVLDVSFDGWEVDHLPGERLFAYAIPLSAMGGAAPAEIRLRGRGVDEVHRQTGEPAPDLQVVREGADGVRVRWNAARAPAVIIRDASTGEILSFARGGDARVRTLAAEIEVNMSDGVNSTIRRFPMPR
jgi:hypothetical protein